MLRNVSLAGASPAHVSFVNLNLVNASLGDERLRDRIP
jgi:hypothetical protein